MDPTFNFQEIYTEFRPRIQRYLTRLAGEDEAEDLTQEVFIKVDRALKTFRGESKIATWIYQIATYTALDKVRSPSFRERQRKSIQPESAEGKENALDLLEEDTASTDQRVILQEMNGCIREIVDTLPGDYRSVIVLSELEGLKNQEIAEVLGVSLENVKIRLHRARALLKKELSSACVFYRDDRNEFACDRKSPITQLLPMKKNE